MTQIFQNEVRWVMEVIGKMATRNRFFSAIASHHMQIVIFEDQIGAPWLRVNCIKP